MRDLLVGLTYFGAGLVIGFLLLDAYRPDVLVVVTDAVDKAACVLRMSSGTPDCLAFLLSLWRN